MNWLLELLWYLWTKQQILSDTKKHNYAIISYLCDKTLLNFSLPESIFYCFAHHVIHSVYCYFFLFTMFYSIIFSLTLLILLCAIVIVYYRALNKSVQYTKADRDISAIFISCSQEIFTYLICYHFVLSCNISLLNVQYIVELWFCWLLCNMSAIGVQCG